MRNVASASSPGSMPGGNPITGRAAQDARQLAELDRKLARADHPDLAVGDLEILLGGFQHMAGELLALSATARAASCTEEPAVTVWRLAKPPSPSGTPAVSPA